MLGEPEPAFSPSYILPLAEQRVKEERERLTVDEFERRYRGDDGFLQKGWTRKYSAGAILIHEAQPPHSPFWVISASPDIVAGHSGIWSYEFLDFMRQVYTETVRPAEDHCRAAF